MKNTKDYIKQLNNKLLAWAEHYYVNDEPKVSDEEYDGSYIEYKELIENNKELEPSDSILKLVGGRIDNRFKKVEHEHKMLSLSNAFSTDDLFKFDKQIKDLLHDDSDIEYTIEYKIDGLSISIIYQDGKLLKAVTRGDGFIGEDVTHNVKQIKDVPHLIDYNKTLEVRGEIFMSDDVFKKLNENGASFANPRNAASGSIRQLDSQVAKERNLSTFIYEIPNKNIADVKTHSGLLKFMNSKGFNTNKETKIVKNINEVVKQVEILQEKRNTLGYAVDGIVIKVNNISLYEDIGQTVKFPKYMIAYKFPAETAVTTLEKIFVTIGRTGRVTYNAKLSPVRLAGSVVSAATLHNADYVRKLNINEGDTVVIKKAGDIIPKVVELDSKNNNEIWREASICNGCHREFVRKENEVDQYCLNRACELVELSSLEHFVSKNAMDIEGVSTQILKTLLDNELITNISSLYELKNHKEDLLCLEGFKEKSVNKMLEAIETSKTQSLSKFLFGMGIRHLGAKGSKTLARRFGTLENIMNASREEIILIRDLGEKVSVSIFNFFNDNDNIDLIKKLKVLGLNLKEEKTSVSSIFEGQTFVVTGTLSKSRKHYIELIESNGGNVSSAVSKNTSRLLVGLNPGSKNVKAKQLGVKIINEIEFEAELESE